MRNEDILKKNLIHEDNWLFVSEKDTILWARLET